jgi:elongation factor 3
LVDSAQVREAVTAGRRQCCVIVLDMSKLVEEPAEAAPLLPEVLPALIRAVGKISDCVAERAVAQINKIKDTSGHTLKRKRGEQAAIDSYIADPVKGTKIATSPVILEHLGHMAAMLLDCNNIEAPFCVKRVKPTLKAYLGGESAASRSPTWSRRCAAYVREEAEVPEGEDAARGTKILLHTTNMRLLRGARYGLLGDDDSVKSRLLRTIASGQVFPSASEVCTVFVEAHIHCEVSHLACIVYTFADPRIQACGVSKEDIAPS